MNNLDINHLINVYKEEVFNLKNENIMLKALIRQMEEQNKNKDEEQSE